MAGLSSTLRVFVLGATLAGATVAPGAALADGPGYGGTANALTVLWRVQSRTGNGGLALYAVGFRAGSQVRLRVGAAPERVAPTDRSGALRVLVVRGLPAPAAPSSHPAASRSVPSLPAASRSAASSSAASRSAASSSAASRSVPSSSAASRSVPSRSAASRSVLSNALLVRPAERATAGPAAERPTDMTVLTVPAESISRLSPGTSVLVVGETPTGAVRTLVGSVPPPQAGWGARDLALGVAGASLLAAVVLRTRRRGAVAAGILRRYRRPARHRA